MSEIKCECGSVFKSKSSLYSHRNRSCSLRKEEQEKKEEQTYKCDMCNKEYKSNQALQNHQAKCDQKESKQIQDQKDPKQIDDLGDMMDYLSTLSIDSKMSDEMFAKVHRQRRKMIVDLLKEKQNKMTLQDHERIRKGNLASAYELYLKMLAQELDMREQIQLLRANSAHLEDLMCGLSGCNGLVYQMSETLGRPFISDISDDPLTKIYGPDPDAQ